MASIIVKNLDCTFEQTTLKFCMITRFAVLFNLLGDKDHLGGERFFNHAQHDHSMEISHLVFNSLHTRITIVSWSTAGDELVARDDFCLKRVRIHGYKLNNKI